MDLQGAIQFLHLQQDHTSIEHAVDELARILFGQMVLQVHQTAFRFTELECYYYHPRYHQDSYAHQHQLQLEALKWYFHGSGLDLTIGNKQQGAYGGILIRGVHATQLGYTSGPIKALRVMMAQLAAANQPQSFYLKKQKHHSKRPVLIKKSPRIGLNPQKDPLFLSKPYRYLLDWEKEVKGHHFKNKTAVRQSNQSISL